MKKIKKKQVKSMRKKSRAVSSPSSKPFKLSKAETEEKISLLMRKDDELTRLEASINLEDGDAERITGADSQYKEAQPIEQVRIDIEPVGIVAMGIFFLIDFVLDRYKKPKFAEEQRIKLKPLYDELEKKWGLNVVPDKWKPEAKAAIQTIFEVGNNLSKKSIEPGPQVSGVPAAQKDRIQVDIK